MYSYPITPRQLKVMWQALNIVVDKFDLPASSWSAQTINDLRDYFEKEDEQ